MTLIRLNFLVVTPALVIDLKIESLVTSLFFFCPELGCSMARKNLNLLYNLVKSSCAVAS